ncbi:LmeA family phospholipid-binding protein [Leptothoe sp. PORK10 BA2]|uniref:LmeA family phospholipid-binding protein n=1 Tax=Leptothoe sp. PORK10 BA2 TaxID=3110254 RepID=UPI002B21C75B|nr:DUF2993 domain-containing protein [Leptothoe sp. PORK10 BA2]MEA5466142.1 DUF2993 domain-containing protein [Leptothoe sp. PORK10 BA2]
MPPSPSTSQGSRLISRVLPVAVKFWLQTQLDDIGDLSFEIQATDRQVLTGQIPGLALSAQGAVYKGARITAVNMQARDIQINIGQVLRGKPLRLKQAFPIQGQVVFAGEDLAVSSTASVLADGLLDFWQTLLAKADVAAEVAAHYGPHTMAWQDLTQYQSKMETAGSGLRLHLISQGEQQNAPQTPTELCLQGKIAIDQGQILQLTTAHWGLPSGDWVPSEALRGFSWNLGEHIDVQSLAIENDRLSCQCAIMVQP